MKSETFFYCKQQADKFVVTCSNKMFNQAIQDHGEWLALQDIPQPFIRAVKAGPPKESPKLSPPGLNRKHQHLSNADFTMGSPATRPPLTMQPPPSPLPDSGPSGNKIFLMDDADLNATPETESIAGQGLAIPIDPDVSLKCVPVWTHKSSTPW